MHGHVETLTHSLDSGHPIDFETRLRRFDGVYRWFQLRGHPARDTDGRIVRWYCLMTDVDDRKRAEDELRRSEAFLADAQRLSRTGSFSWQVAAEEMEWSEETYRIYELDPGTPVTFDLVRARVHPDNLSTLQEVMGRARREGGDFDYETRLLMPDQSIKYLRVVAHSVRNKDGEIELRGAVQDVTAGRLAEEALEKVRSELGHVTRIMSLGALTASIAHEVNQPLSGIITNASTCLRMLAADPPKIDIAQETARRTIRDGNRAADVIARLRALFTKRTATIEPVDLNDAVREVIALSSSDLQRGRVVLRTELADELPPVGGDRIQLQQVVMNLLRNATDAMSGVDDRPRRLVIRTEPDEEAGIRLSVKDVGIGFGPAGAERLFEAFYTTKSDGMGIGLSVSRSIIETHNGRLWASPNDGPGVTFCFSIPEYFGDETSLHQAGAMQAPASQQCPECSGDFMKATHPLVSVVDDDESVREFLPDLIRAFGLNVEAFSSAEAFLASDSIRKTSCLILDVGMPGMTGPDLQRELARRGQSIPIIFITAQKDDTVRPRLLERGAVECLFKPFSDAALQKALSSVAPNGLIIAPCYVHPEG